MNMANQTREVVRATTAPIVYHPGGWEDSLPAEITAQVVPARLRLVLAGQWDHAPDLEVMCYLFTVTLVGPMDHDWAQIYAYVTALWKPGAKNVLEAPDELDPGQQEKLDQLKRQIWESQQSRKETAMLENVNVKVVLDVHKDGVRVGIGAEGCDPIITPITGELAGALDEVPQLVADAQARWGEAPRNPKYTKPRASRAKAKAADADAQPPADAGAEQPKPQPDSAEPPADAATTEAVPATPDNTGGASAEALPLLGEDPPGKTEAELAAAEQEATADAAKVTETIAAPTGVAGVNPPLACGFGECGFEAFSQDALDDHISHAHAPETPEAPETPAEPVQAAQAAPTSGGWVYVVKGVSHPTVHEALRAVGETQAEIDGHKFWHRHDRLPKRLQDAIEKRSA
jgi:hypothetical protein